MTISTHVYSAVVIGSPDVALSVRGGSLTLDSGSAPHVQGTLTLAMPSLATLAKLDPRTGAPRVRVTATGQGETRTFNLGIRERQTSQRDATVTLTLASDEALLGDYAPLADDDTPIAHQASLRAVVGYVLGKAIPGAVLAAGGPNPAATVFSDADNLVPNPRVQGLTGYSGEQASVSLDGVFPGAQGGIAHNGVHISSPTTSDSYAVVAVPLTPGKTYTLSATGSVRATLSGSISGRARRIVVLYRVAGVFSEVTSPQISATVNASTRVSVTVTIPAEADVTYVRLYLGATTGTITWALPRISETSPNPGADNSTYFHGGTTDTDEYDYTWTSAADASASKRRALIDRSPDLLWWRAGTPALDFLGALVQGFGLRLVCDETRTWTLRDVAYVAPGSSAIRYAVNLIDGDDTLSRSEDWCDAAVVVYTWRDRAGVDQEKVDAFATSSTPTRVRRVEMRSPYPGPGYAQHIVQRGQGRGRSVTATSVSDWRVRAEQPVTIVLDAVPIQTGLTQSVTFDLDTDEMTIDTRTTDTPIGALDLLVGTIDSLTGTINSL